MPHTPSVCVTFPVNSLPWLPKFWCGKGQQFLGCFPKLLITGGKSTASRSVSALWLVLWKSFWAVLWAYQSCLSVTRRLWWIQSSQHITYCKVTQNCALQPFLKIPPSDLTLDNMNAFLTWTEQTENHLRENHVNLHLWCQVVFWLL